MIWRPLVLLALLCTLAAVPACSSGNDSEIVGSWTAREMLLTSQENPEVSVDLIGEFGASFDLTIGSSGRYEAVLVAFGDTDVEVGDVAISGSTITLDPDGAGSPTTGVWSLSDGVLTIDAGSEFDFNGDQVPDAADLHLELLTS